MTLSDADRFVLEKWDEVTRLVRIHAGVEGKMEAALKAAFGKVKPWLESQGFEADCEYDYAEFVAFRQAWCLGKVPMVRMAVGGLCPTGYRKVDCKAPYLWVYIRRPKGGEFFNRSVRRAFTKRLREKVGPDLSVWTNDEVDDTAQPLGRYVGDFDCAARVGLAVNPEKMASLAIEQFPGLLSLADSIDKALAPVLAEKPQ